MHPFKCCQAIAQVVDEINQALSLLHRPVVHVLSSLRVLTIVQIKVAAASPVQVDGAATATGAVLALVMSGCRGTQGSFPVHTSNH